MNKKLFLSIVFLLFLSTMNTYSQNCDGFKTFTNGGWGTICHGGNAGCYRDDNFAKAFPNGLTIGCTEGYTIKLTSTDAVKSFLPASGSKSVLTKNLMDPTKYKNTLAGQLVALTLSVGFDAYDTNFASNTGTLSNLTIASGVFAGETVGSFLLIANKVMGGCTTAYSLADINSTADAINQNYDNGTVDKGFLTCDKSTKDIYTIDIIIDNDVICYGEKNGKATVTATGGVAPYVFTLNDGITSGSINNSYYSFTNLDKGDYTVTVIDTNGKEISATFENHFTITEPAKLVAEVVSITNVSCNGKNNGSATASVTGGTESYSYSWDTTPAQTTATATNLAPGEYTVTITDANSCSTTASVTITEPDVLAANATPTAVLCKGDNGTVILSVSGGTSPYTYLWSNSAITENLSDVVAGTYDVTITDANNCSTTASATIKEPAESLTASADPTAVLCKGGNGAVTLSVSGGTSPYTYLWSNAADTENLSDVVAGKYDVTIRDANGCSTTASATVTEPDALVASSTEGTISCFGGTTTVTISATGGTAPYKGTGIFTVSAGDYSYTVTDANGCTSTASGKITQPETLALSIAKTDITCFDGFGTATATVIGGTKPYAYSWNAPNQTNSENASLKAGTWSVTVTDANGCSISKNITLVLLTCEGFTTVTQGGYGAKCSGNNWGCYLVNNFNSKLPSGLTIGSGAKLIKLTSAAAVQAFLPSGGTARALNTGTLTDPKSKSYSNVLAGQTVALALSLAFDANPNFSPSSTSLGSLVINSGVFAGKTVNELLGFANTVLGGGSSIYTPAQVNAALDAVNRNYDNGTVNLGYLACPCNLSTSKFSSGKLSTTTKIETSNLNATETSFVLYPNPVTENATFDFSLNYDSSIKIELYNINGQRISTIYDNVAKAGVEYSININAASLSSGTYFMMLHTNKEVINKRVVITK